MSTPALEDWNGTTLAGLASLMANGHITEAKSEINDIARDTARARVFIESAVQRFLELKLSDPEVTDISAWLNDFAEDIAREFGVQGWEAFE